MAAPSIVTNVRPSDAFGYSGEVELTWSTPSNGGSPITGYIVQTSVDDGDNWVAHSTPASSPSTLTGLTPNQRYDFRVAAVNADGTGPFGVSEWGCTPVESSTPITPPSTTTRSASATGLWGIDEIDGDSDNLASSTWTGAGVRVYYVDSNFLLTHSEFANQDFEDGYAIDGLTLGSLAYGEDHGTAVASVCVGLTVGVAYDAILIPVASNNESETTPIYNCVEALQWVYDNHPPGVPGIVVTSNLWGDDGAAPAPGVPDTDGRRTSVWFPLVDALVTSIIEDKGMAFVQCIGNADSPTHIDLDARPGLVLVSYSNEAYSYATGSNGSEFTSDTTIIAPGDSIRSATTTGGYATKSGTSFAAPMTGGAMACWLEANPNLTPRQLVDILICNSLKGVLSNATGGAPNRFLQSLVDIADTSLVSVEISGSKSVSQTTSDVGQIVSPGTPSAISDLDGVSNQAGEVSLSWTAPTTLQ